MNLRRILSQAALVIGALVFSIGLQAYAASFTGPAEGFPNSDAQAPLDTGANANVKVGGLVINSGGAPNGLLVPSGNVGIGTVSPATKLDVKGTVSVRGNFSEIFQDPDISGMDTWKTAVDGNGYYWKNETKAAVRMVISSLSGNVGIGTSPVEQSKVTVAGSISLPGASSDSNFSAGGNRGIIDTAGSAPNIKMRIGMVQGGGSATGGIDFLTNSGVGMSLDASGNVGIGVASPQTKLDIAGAIKVGDFATCGVAQAGAIRYNSGNFQGCNGSTWVTLSGAVASGSQTWSTSGPYSFTVPSGVSVIDITTVGGGGAGGCGGGSDKNTNGGGGGGGGAGSIGIRTGYAVTQGEIFNLTVGGGGINPGGCGGGEFTGNGATGVPGTQSSVVKVSTGTLVISGNPGSGGSGGVYSSGAEVGSVGASCPPYGTGGAGNGLTTPGDPASGNCAGGGGGGGGNTSSNPQGAEGGTGGAGLITISW